MQYKTELHAHTRLVSPCADIPYEEEIERYIRAGYTSITVTDHYCDYVIDPAGNTWEEKLDHYLSGYRAVKAYAKGRINVLLGCELRFTENVNDYLIFGLTEEFLREHPDLHKMTLATFSHLARENGLLVVQAHPFRNRMTMMNPKYLDGVEIFNGHPGHDSRNFLALSHAKRYGLIPTSGSDFHHPHSVEAGGILTDEPVTSAEQLVRILKGGNYTLVCTGPAAERDGMTDMSAASVRI